MHSVVEFIYGVVIQNAEWYTEIVCGSAFCVYGIKWEFAYVVVYRIEIKVSKMHKEFLMGNEAIALGAMAAGVNVVSGYPGTPSTEVLEVIAKRNDGSTYVEWSVNEKAGLEVAAAAAYSGARSIVTMKQVGLNVASDPLMSLAYVGVKGGMVVMVADDPGPISSQTEQDTRTFGQFAKLPVFDPSSAAEAYEMIQTAFEVSEKHHTPVIFRSTTRVCHAYASLEVKDKEEYYNNEIEGFKKDSGRWVIFPRLSFCRHGEIETALPQIADELGSLAYNKIEGSKAAAVGIACGGISYAYVKEALAILKEKLGWDFLGEEKTGKYPVCRLMKVGTPHPFPEEQALSFMDGLEQILVVEELDPYIERMLLQTAGKYQKTVAIHGKMDGSVKVAGENTVESVMANICELFQLDCVCDKDRVESGSQTDGKAMGKEENAAAPELPVRPPVLCAGCPHRASFYAVKRAMEGRKAVFCGDIGCYTLGNAMPLDMVDTCLCMGAGITMAQGFGAVEKDITCFAFVGDSTFFASGMTGVVNAVYNQHDMVLVVLDNSTTAMTGHQPHPGTGKTMMGDIVNKVSIVKILEAMGLTEVRTVNPLDLEDAIEAVREVADKPGVKAIIFKSPCIAVSKPESQCSVNADTCINCKKCIRELGCPAITVEDGKVVIEPSLCFGCGICKSVCPVHAIEGGRSHE